MTERMRGWTFHNPVRIRFGMGVLEEIAEILAGRSYVLVTYPDDFFRSLAGRIAALAGEPRLVIDGVEQNPSIAMLHRTGARLCALPRTPDVLVALGGGSVMDTAKILATGRGQVGPVIDYLDGGRDLAQPAWPVIAIPTTAGTGSEVTSWATVWDPERNRKLSLSRADLYPEAALVDPLLTMKLPKIVTIASGLDALSHALESLWNIHANPITRGLAVQAAREIMPALIRLSAAPDDAEARSRTALGALRAGLAFSNTRTALAHNISYPLTLERRLAHGIACSFCLPAVMTAALGADPACDAALAEIFGNPEDAPARLRAFLGALGVATDPAAYGVGPLQWRAIVEQGFTGPRGRNFIGAMTRFPF